MGAGSIERSAKGPSRFSHPLEGRETFRVFPSWLRGCGNEGGTEGRRTEERDTEGGSEERKAQALKRENQQCRDHQAALLPTTV